MGPVAPAPVQQRSSLPQWAMVPPRERRRREGASLERGERTRVAGRAVELRGAGDALFRDPSWWWCLPSAGLGARGGLQALLVQALPCCCQAAVRWQRQGCYPRAGAGSPGHCWHQGAGRRTAGERSDAAISDARARRDSRTPVRMADGRALDRCRLAGSGWPTRPASWAQTVRSARRRVRCTPGERSEPEHRFSGRQPPPKVTVWKSRSPTSSLTGQIRDPHRA